MNTSANNDADEGLSSGSESQQDMSALQAPTASKTQWISDEKQLGQSTPLLLPPGIPPRIDRYRLLRFIGSGGFGLVFEANDELSNRRVAIKLARSHVTVAESLTKRFLDEARTVAGLKHVGIVSPLDADVFDGQPFIVYPLCPGPNLSQWLASIAAPVAPRLAAQIMMQLADAVAFSHANFVLHRDIKPANVLLFPSSTDDPEFCFVPRLTDFGLAKSIQLDASATASTVWLGTPFYLPPEEINGIHGPRESSDIYSLGVVMYEVLTGKRPFESDNFFELARKIREQPPTNPRELQEALPVDIAHICMTCLQKNPEDRYASAALLSEDLRRFLNGVPIRANPISYKQRFIRFIDDPMRRSELRALSIGLSLALIAWSVVGLSLVSSRGEAELTFTDAAMNTVALVSMVAVPLMVSGIGCVRAKTWAMWLGLFATLLGIVVSLLSFTKHPVVYPQVYDVNPVARTIVFTLLLIAFAGLFTCFAMLLARQHTKANRVA